MFREIFDAAVGVADVSDSSAVSARLQALSDEVTRADDLVPVERVSLRFTLSSMAINAGSDFESADLIKWGQVLAESVALDDVSPDILVPQAIYNVANAGFELADLEAKADGREASRPSERLKYLEARRRPRVLSRFVGGYFDAPAETRSRALTNLANVLDDSGRWVEAYAAYADALAVWPVNGNAAGNMAELLRRRLVVGREQRGHVAAVYDAHVRLAKSLRENTVEIAGLAVADRWEALEETGSEGHLAHGSADGDEYGSWVSLNRLALASAVEGLGTDDVRWDTATIRHRVPTVEGRATPGIFAALNVLKAEYLVARRMAFRGLQTIEESQGRQHDSDTGVYADTEDDALYGEAPASLVLAQRAALDVLDKIAVAANEHFKVGQRPGGVNFSTFWIDGKTGEPRIRLDEDSQAQRALLALTELNSDIHEDGLYPAARLLRNAGTHRIVHATFGESTGATKETFSSVEIPELEAAVIDALQVTRAAYLYFLDLVDLSLDDEEGDVVAGQTREIGLQA